MDLYCYKNICRVIDSRLLASEYKKDPNIQPPVLTCIMISLLSVLCTSQILYQLYMCICLYSAVINLYKNSNMGQFTIK